jgi:hypothetical protein
VDKFSDFRSSLNGGNLDMVPNGFALTGDMSMQNNGHDMVTNSFITNIFNQPESALKSGIDNNAKSRFPPFSEERKSLNLSTTLAISDKEIS